MKLFKEFKEFLNRGNVVDLAVGVVIGAAFKAIVDSFVGDIISPLIGSIFNMDFSALTVTINGAELRYGAFIMAIINFIILAFVLFLMLKGMNKLISLRKKEEEKKEEEPAEPSAEEKLLTEIRDLLKEKN